VYTGTAVPPTIGRPRVLTVLRIPAGNNMLPAGQGRLQRRIKVDSNVFHKISYGLYIIGTREGERRNGQVANTIFQVCSDPPLVAVAINKQNLTHELLEKTGKFSASILAEETPLKFIGLFGFNSGRDLNKFDKARYKDGVTGVPIPLENIVGYLEVEVSDSLDVASHTLFVGKVREAEVLRDSPPLTYAYYHAVKRGKTPKTAPSYTAEAS